MSCSTCCLITLLVLALLVYNGFAIMCIFFVIYPHAAYKFTDALSTYSVKDDPWRYQVGYGVAGGTLLLIELIVFTILMVHLCKRCYCKKSKEEI